VVVVGGVTVGVNDLSDAHQGGPPAGAAERKGRPEPERLLRSTSVGEEARCSPPRAALDRRRKLGSFDLPAQHTELVALDCDLDVLGMLVLEAAEQFQWHMTATHTTLRQRVNT
jgi:hypothetical protein